MTIKCRHAAHQAVGLGALLGPKPQISNDAFSKEEHGLTANRTDLHAILEVSQSLLEIR